MPQTFVNAPSDTVWNAISDLTRHVEWTPNLTIEAVDGGEFAVGSKFNLGAAQRQGPGPAHCDWSRA